MLDEPLPLKVPGPLDGTVSAVACAILWHA